MLSRLVLNAHSARLRSIFYIVFILFFFSGRHLWGNLPVLAAPAERPLASPVPGVTIGAPSNPFIGSALTLTLTFDNTSATDTGYGPYIDLFLPLSGADGQNPPPQDDGISFVSANYLGASVTTQVLNCPAGGNVTHPLTGQTITCPAQPPGLYSPFVWQLVVITLPFGSFVPDQPPASVTVNAQLSTYADVGVALPIQARGGFMFGADPLDNPATDPPIQGSMTSTDVTPSLFTLEKSYLGPEDETATGPNFPRRYTVTATIAPGQTMTSFTLTDVLPNNMQFVSVVSTTPGGATCTTPSTTTPGGTLSCAFSGSVSGTVSMTFEYYIPLRDSGGASVIDPVTGDDALSCNNASASGYWDAADPRDTDQPVSQDAAGCEHTLTDKSIAIQKSVNVVGGGQPKPGAVLEYTLDFQISDFFAFNDVVITDVISDGQHFAPGFIPTLQVNGNGYTLAAASMQASNVTTACNYSGAVASPPAPPGECDMLDPAVDDGTTTITFNVSQEIRDRLGLSDGRLIGGCVPTGGTGGGDPDCGVYNDDPTTGRIVFRTIIQENFTDTYPSGDASVDQGDVLNNTVRIAGNVLSTSNASTLTGNSEEDESAASVSIPYGTIAKSIYAINGSTSFSSPVHVKPGDTVTYRITYTLPTSDFEDLVITDYLPLPVFSATEVTSFSNAVCGIPNAGQSCLGPSDSYHSLSGAVNPAFSTSASGNWVRWTYGDYDAPNNPPSTIDLLFTVTVRNDPFADGLYLTNQAFAQEGSTNSSGSEATGIIQITLDEPALRISKGVVWTNNPNGGFTPSPVGPVTFDGSAVTCAGRLGGPINSSGLAANPVNSNLNNVDAADQVMMAIIIENTGHASAFDVRVRDSLPAGMTYVSGSLCVTDGTGAAFTYLSGGLDGSGLFDADGIELVDPGPTSNPPGALDPGKDSNGNTIDNGRNIAVITYRVTLDSTVQGGQFYTNTATLFNYSNTEGGLDFTAEDPTDTAQTQIRYDGLGKTFTTEIINSYNSQTQVVIGEYIDYTLTITFHEGTTPNVTLEEQLPAGLAFVDCIRIQAVQVDSGNQVYPTNALSTSLGSFDAACNDPINPDVSSPGQNFTFTLGTITNGDTDNTKTEQLRIEFRAVTLNVMGNQSGTNLVNRATLVIDDGAGGTATVQSAPATVIEPVVNTAKTVSPATADAGDTVTFTVTLSNPASGSTTAYDVTWSDVVPAGLTYSVSTLSGSCTTHALTLSDASAPTLTGSVSQLDPGETCTITFNAIVDYSVTPGQSINNIAQTQWTSMSGVVTDRSTYNANSDERTGADGTLGSGVLNDYRTEGSASVTINVIAPQKFLRATSEAHTGVVSGMERVTIGEIVRYRLVVQLPEGTSPNFQIRDYLETGLTYLDDGTAKVAFVSNGGGITSSDYGTLPVPGITDPDCFLTGNFADATTPAIPSSCAPLADENVGSDNSTSVDNDNYSSGTYPSFKLGTLTNNDNDSDAEYVILEFNVLVDNTLAGNNDAGEYRVNGFGVWIDDVKNGEDANWVRVDIVEPALSLTKAVTIAPVDAGDPITYTLTISAASGDDRSTAFDLTLTDTLDPYFVIGSVNIAPSSWTCVGNGGVSIPFSGNYSWGGSPTVVTVTANCLDPGQSITVTISGTVAANAPAGYTIPNTANLTWTSLPGTGTSPNPTGGTTPGGSGADNGERDGSGGINDYTASANANAPLSTPQIVKGAPTPTSYTIGATVTYPITITLPEGVTRNVRVTDAVPTGMQYVSYSLDTSAFGGTVPAPTVTGGASNGDDVTFTFGDITTTDDNNSANNSFILYVNLSVLNVSTNYDGVILPNSASLTYWPGTGTTDTTIPGGTQNITVIEPQITTTKSVNPTGGVQAGNTITYTVRFTNTGNSTAYDVTAEDTFAQGVTYNVGSASCVFFDGSTTSSIGVTVTVGAGTLTFDGNPPGSWDIPATNPDSYIQCTYTATAQNSLYLDGAHTNTIDADWSSLNGSDPEERLYNDSGTSPLDGTQDTASATFNSPAPTFDKSDNATDLPIGAAYTVALTLTSPLGTLRNLTITDTLPTGLFYVTSSQSVSGGISPAPTFTVTGPNDGSAPTTLTWTFGDAVVSSSPITITYNVVVANVADNQNGTVRTNTATLSYDDASGNPQSQTDTEDVTVLEPALTVDKIISVPPSPPDAGGTVTYQVTIQHDGTSTAAAYDVNFTDALPAELTLNLASVTVTLNGGAAGATDNSAGNTVNVTIASIPLGGSVTIAYSATINSNVTPGQTVTNTGNLTWTSTAGANTEERNGNDGPGGALNDYAAADSASFDISSSAYDKTLEATSAAHTSGNDLAIGEIATFGLYVTLPEGTTPSLTIVDDLPTGLEYVSGSAQVVTTVAGCGSLTADFNGSVPTPTITAPGGSGGDVTFQFSTITVTADNNPNNNTFVVCFNAVLLDEAGNQNGGTLTNNASFQIGSGPVTNDSTTVDVVEPELEILKAVSNPTPGVGQTFTYTLTIQHLGTSAADAFDLVISDPLPANLNRVAGPTVSDAPLGCAGIVTDTTAGDNIGLTVASLPLGCVLTVTYDAQVDAAASPGDMLTNTATLTWTSLPGSDPNERDGSGGVDDYTDTANQTITYTVVDLRVTKDDGGITTTAGGVVAYTLNYTNAGNSVATGVVITETVPANTTFNAAASTAGWSCADGSPAGTICTFNIGTLNPGGSGSVTFAVKVNNPLPAGVAQISNTASIADDGTHGSDANPGDNTASDTTPVDAAPDLTITKDDGLTVVSPGQTITYTLTISNVGTQDATGVVITDTIPANTTFVSASDGGTESGGVVTWPTIALAANTSVTRTVTIRVNDPFPGTSILNQAHVEDDGANGSDPTPGNNDGNDTDTVLTLPNSDLTKSLIATNQGFTSGSSVAIGEIVTYEVTFTVPAGGTLPNLTLTDILDRGLAFVDCVSITPSSTDITTTLLGGFAAACNDPTNPTIATEPPGSTNPADPGRRVTFSLGDVSNSGASNGTVSIRYTAVVLDTIENQDGLSLNNEATLTWSSGSLTTSAPNVTIVEPDFELIKEADRTVAMPGSIITFTLTFRHTNLSNVDAFDVVLTDVLPPGLTYVPGSLTIVSGPTGGVTDDTAAPTLRVRWSTFPLLTGGSRTEAVVRFQAVLGNLLPGQKVRNTASLEWTSLPGDVSTPQSPYNDTSTERYYDPLSPVNVYGVQASVTITVPQLPRTGFAPGRLTSIPVQPPEKAYQDLGDLWLEIPKLGLKMPIVGVPAKGEEWDLTWLWDQAGWLEGTAYPTHAGNAALTAHVYLPNGEPGPFFNLGNLVWGDQIIVHLGGQAYIYEVRQVRQISPNSLSALRHEELPWLTLITCREYDARTNSYRYRVVVRAVLIKIVGE